MTNYEYPFESVSDQYNRNRKVRVSQEQYPKKAQTGISILTESECGAQGYHLSRESAIRLASGIINSIESSYDEKDLTLSLCEAQEKLSKATQFLADKNAKRLADAVLKSRRDALTQEIINEAYVGTSPITPYEKAHAFIRAAVDIQIRKESK